jgi:gas vesicle protein
MARLTELPADTLLSYEDAHEQITAEELIKRIKSGEEDPEYTNEWKIAIPQTWTANAKAMIKRHIEDCYDEMYEDWDERVKDELKKHPEQVEKIQAILNEIFESKYISEYWILGELVEVDIQADKEG